jgi:large subunit ribosomal protein L19e
MDLKIQKRLAAEVLNCSEKRVILDTTKLEDIKEAITKADIRSLINDGAITRRPIKGVSRFWAKYISSQKKKGRRKGFGSRKGVKTARLGDKEKWMNSVRLQRKFLKELRAKSIISRKNYADLYMKSKGGFFRSKQHIKLFIEEHNLASKK